MQKINNFNEEQARSRYYAMRQTRDQEGDSKSMVDSTRVGIDQMALLAVDRIQIQLDGSRDPESGARKSPRRKK